MGGGSLSPLPGLLERTSLAELAARFGARLRESGLPVGPEREGRFAAALALVRPLTLGELAGVGRITLVGESAHLAAYERVFAEVFRGLSDPAESRGDTAAPEQRRDLARRSSARPPVPGRSPAARPGEEAGDDGEERTLDLASGEERLGHKDFAECSDAELERLRGLAAGLQVSVPTRRARRRRRHGRGTRADLRATLARARRTGGDPAQLVRRRRVRRPRRLVMIADVSGSMEPYTRIYLHLFHAAVRAARAEAFVFATRLTRLTPALGATDPDLALRLAGEAAQDWAGGTRIGEALAEFNDRYGRRGMARGAVVVVVSDGWEGGDPLALGDEMARLSRMANRVVWVNPRSASPRFRPETQGMAAALPYVDHLVSGHSLAALEQLLGAIRGEPEEG